MKAARHLVEAERGHQREGPASQQQAERAAGHRQQHRLGDDLTRQAGDAGAEGMARGELALPGARPDNHEVRDIDGADEKHEEHAAPQQVEHGTNLAHEIGLEQDGVGPETGVLEDLPEVRKALVVAGVDRVELCLGLLDRGVRLQPADHLIAVAVAPLIRLVLGREGERRPEVDVGPEKLKIRRHHADDRARHAVDPQRLSDDVGPRAEARLPEAVTDDDLQVVARLPLGFLKDAAERGTRLQNAEQRRRRLYGGQPLGAGVEADRGARAPVERERLHAVHRLQAVEIVGHAVRRAAGPGVRIAVEDVDQPVGLRDGQRPQQHGLHDGEDRRVRADADGQREQHGGGEAAVLQQDAQGISEVLQETGHGRPTGITAPEAGMFRGGLV